MTSEPDRPTYEPEEPAADVPPRHTPSSKVDDDFPRTTMHGEVDDHARPGFSTADDAVTRELLFPDGRTVTAAAAQEVAYGGAPHTEPEQRRRTQGR